MTHRVVVGAAVLGKAHVFVGVLTDDDLVEIVDFAHDPDYWQLLDESTDT